MIWQGAGPRINGTDSCSARCGVVEKHRSPRAGLRARRSGPHAQHAAEAPRRGPASASAGAGRRGHDHDMQCTLDPGRSRDRRAVLLGVPPARTSNLYCAAPIWARRLGADVRHSTRQPLETPATRVDPTGRCHGIPARTASLFGWSRDSRDLRPLWGCHRRGRGMPMHNPLRRARVSPASPGCSRTSPSYCVRPQAAPELEPGSLNRSVAEASQPVNRSAHVPRAAVALRSSRSNVDDRITRTP